MLEYEEFKVNQMNRPAVLLDAAILNPVVIRTLRGGRGPVICMSKERFLELLEAEQKLGEKIQ